MPALPFTSASSSPASSPTSSPTSHTTPSIVLHPASGTSSTRDLLKSKEDVAEAYRLRYAQYLAAALNISIHAALSEADAQLAPRRTGGVAEAELYREF